MFKIEYFRYKLNINIMKRTKFLLFTFMTIIYNKTI